MKRLFILCALLLSLLFHTACRSSSVSPANPSFREDSPQYRMEIWFRFHSQLLDEISKSASYKELVDKDEWANSVQETISLEINEGNWTFDQWADLNRRLRAAEAEEDIRYVDTFMEIRSSVALKLLYIRSVIEGIDRSMDIWDEPSGILGRQEEILVCAQEALPYASDAGALGLETEFSALARAASAAVQRSSTLLSKGPEIREHLRKRPY